MVPFIVHGEVLDCGGVAGEVGLGHEGEGVPEDNLPFLSTTRNHFMLRRIHKRINTLLMQIKRSPFLIR